MKKTILFDLDGTLIDSTSAILESFEVAFKFYNRSIPSHANIKSLIGNPLEIMFIGLGVPQDLAHEYVAAYKAHYERIYLEQTTLLPFAYEAIKLASQMADVGIVTTKTSKFSANILENLGVMKFIKAIIGRDDVINPKPDPEPVNTALARLSKTSAQDRANAFMIGDTPMDIQAANSADINGLAVLCGYASFEILEKYTKNIFKNSLEATQFVAKF